MNRQSAFASSVAQKAGAEKKSKAHIARGPWKSPSRDNKLEYTFASAMVGCNGRVSEGFEHARQGTLRKA
jgi:hypothetical protein